MKNMMGQSVLYLTTCKLTSDCMTCFMKKYSDELKWSQQECPP